MAGSRFWFLLLVSATVPAVFCQHNEQYYINKYVKGVNNLDNFHDSRTRFEKEHQRLIKITLGFFFGFILFFVGILVCVRFCCPQDNIQAVSTPVGVPLEQTVRTHPPPLATHHRRQQFPPKYHSPAPPTQQGQYPLAPPSPGFVYSPVQQQDPVTVPSSPPLLEFQNQFPTTSPYGAPPVFKY